MLVLNLQHRDAAVRAGLRPPARSGQGACRVA
jgi:hypothetical protein